MCNINLYCLSPEDEGGHATHLKVEGFATFKVRGVLPHNSHVTIRDKQSAIALRDWLNEQINHWYENTEHTL